MSESLTRQQKITKQAVQGKGVVVAQNCRAAEVGAEILRKGGNAIDAAVATGMAIGAVEPWMSGIGGGRFTTAPEAHARRAGGGPRNFTEGAGAGDTPPALQAGGSAPPKDDPKSKDARTVEPLPFDHPAVTVNVGGGLTAGPTLRRTMELAGDMTKGKGAPGA